MQNASAAIDTLLTVTTVQHTVQILPLLAAKHKQYIMNNEWILKNTA